MSVGVRRAQRRAALIEAAIELAAAEGPQAIAVRRVCTAARLSPRYFYESFAQRDELLVAAFDVVRREAMQVLRAALEGARAEGPAAALRAAADAYISQLVDPPHRGSLLLVDATAEAALQAPRDEMFREYVQSLTAAGAPLASVLPDTNRLLVRLIFAHSGITDVVRSWRAGSLRIDRKELGDLLTEGLVALASAPH